MVSTCTYMENVIFSSRVFRRVSSMNDGDRCRFRFWQICPLGFSWWLLATLVLMLWRKGGCREIEGEIRIGVFAIEDIKRGTWITYDYQCVPSLRSSIFHLCLIEVSHFCHFEMFLAPTRCLRIISFPGRLPSLFKGCEFLVHWIG